MLDDAAQAFEPPCLEMSLAHSVRPQPPVFSAKPLGCYGDGGALFTNDDQLAAIARSAGYMDRVQISMRMSGSVTARWILCKLLCF